MDFRARTIALLSLVLLPALAAAQAGSVSGTISRTDGSPIDGARISVELPARSATTDQAGHYALRGLPAGRYHVAVSAIGQRLTQRDVEVGAGQTTTLDVRLENGPLMLSGVVTSATRTPAEAGRVAATVNVLTTEQIRTSPARESQDLLREIPASNSRARAALSAARRRSSRFAAWTKGAPPCCSTASPSTTRGASGSTGAACQASLVERVEVIEGGGSNLYGNGAMGGVISFFAKPIAPGSLPSCSSTVAVATRSTPRRRSACRSRIHSTRC